MSLAEGKLLIDRIHGVGSRSEFFFIDAVSSSNSHVISKITMVASTAGISCYDEVVGSDFQMTAAIASVVPDDTFTVTQAVNSLGFGKFQILLSLVVGLCWMSDSMEIMILSILSPALHCEWHISQYHQASYLVSVQQCWVRPFY